jgi:NAD(P)-dependent dehydrogenase (short-subunit alcohol dehydrogenase family)
MNGTSLQKRVALVTGGTDGIGKAIAHVLANQGMHVVIVGSNPGKGAAAARELSEASGNDSICFLQADLSTIGNVDTLAVDVSACWPQLHCLVHCAGIMRGRYTLTSEEIETNFALNYLSRFALTESLLPCLVAGGRDGAAARILVIGGAAQNGRIYYENPNLTRRFNILRVVAQFCAANDEFVLEQARRIAADHPPANVTITTLKVGAVRTAIRRQFPLWMKLLVPVLVDPFLSSSTGQIAASAQRLLLGPEFEGVTGALFRHIRRFKRLQPGLYTGDPDRGRRLWELSEQLSARARSGSRAEDDTPSISGDIHEHVSDLEKSRLL